MRQTSQVIAQGTITKIEERVSLTTHKSSWQVFIRGKQDCVTRVDYYDASLFPAIQELAVGGEITCTGRLFGRLNDRGYLNYSIFGDAIYGGYAAIKGQQTTTQTASDEDIPF